MVAIEDFIYDTIESQWTTPEEITQKLYQAKYTLKDRHLEYGQAEYVVRDILTFYVKNRDPNFREEKLSPIEQRFPDRSERQIAIVDDIHNPGKLRIRKRLTKRIEDTYPRKPVIIREEKRTLSQYGKDGVYFYGFNLEDPGKMWIDPGAIELFLNLLYESNTSEHSVYQLIEQRCPEYLKAHWFIIDEQRKYYPRYLVATLNRETK